MASMPLPNRSNLVASVAQEIAGLVRREGLRPGDRLPTVKELAEQFGVAVPTVREAIRRLEALGTVEIRHGAGIFVRAEQPRMMVAQPNPAAVDGQVILDLLQTRLLVEPYLAEQAALAARGDSLMELDDLLRQAEGHLAGSDHQLQRINMAFHIGIARLSGNVVLIQVMETLVTLYSSEQTAMLSIGDTRLRDHQEHLAILAAIRAGEAEQARDLMLQHLLNAKDLMTARLAAAAHARKVSWLNASRPGAARS